MFLLTDDYYFLALVHNFCKLFSLTNLATFTLKKMPANLPWPFVKTLALFNSIYLIKPLLLCINTFTCLKINKYSTGLFVSYSLKNPIAWKFIVPNVKMAQPKIRNCVSVWCLSVSKFHTKMGWWWTLLTDLFKRFIIWCEPDWMFLFQGSPKDDWRDGEERASVEEPPDSRQEPDPHQEVEGPSASKSKRHPRGGSMKPFS